MRNKMNKSLIKTENRSESDILMIYPVNSEIVSELLEAGISETNIVGMHLSYDVVNDCRNRFAISCINNSPIELDVSEGVFSEIILIFPSHTPKQEITKFVNGVVKHLVDATGTIVVIYEDNEDYQVFDVIKNNAIER